MFSPTRRILVLLVPALAMLAADGDPAPAPRVEAADSSSLNNLDLRLSLGVSFDGILEVTDEDTDVETDYEDGAGGHWAVHVLYLRARPGGVGFAVGGGPFIHAYTGEPEGGGPESTVNALGIDLYAAFVWRPSDNWHFELPALVLSGGSAVVETDGAEDSEVGGYARFAAQLGAYYTFDVGFQLGLDVGVAGFGTTVEYDDTDQEITLSGGGAYANLTLGYRF